MCSCWHGYQSSLIQFPRCRLQHVLEPVKVCAGKGKTSQCKAGAAPKGCLKRPYEERPKPCTASLSSRIPEISLQQAMYESNQDPMTQHGIGLVSKPDETTSAY